MTSGPNPSLPVTQLIGKKKKKKKRATLFLISYGVYQSTPHLHHTLFLLS